MEQKSPIFDLNSLLTEPEPELFLRLSKMSALELVPFLVNLTDSGHSESNSSEISILHKLNKIRKMVKIEDTITKIKRLESKLEQGLAEYLPKLGGDSKKAASKAPEEKKKVNLSPEIIGWAQKEQPKNSKKVDQDEAMIQDSSSQSLSRNEGSIVELNELSILSDKVAYIGRISNFTPKSFTDFPKHRYQIIQLRHKVSQKKLMLFKCRAKNCKKMFWKSCNLRDHLRKHTGKRPFKCLHCPRAFTQNSNCRRHMIDMH